jgi:general secretion pathway protein J
MRSELRTKTVFRPAGFTLVEMLLAITLMSMLLALAYGGLRASTRATDRGQVVLEESSGVRMAHQFIRKQLNQMLPLAFLESEDQEEDIIFSGSSDRIRFVAPMPGYLGFGGPQVQELTLEEGDEGLALVFSHALLQDFEEDSLYERAPIVLLERIDQAQFQFLGVDEEGELLPWGNLWEEGAKLPVAVSLGIDFNEEVFVRWPLLTAAVRIDAQSLLALTEGKILGKDYKSTIQNMIQKGKEDK